jgi:hypothetical protein
VSVQLKPAGKTPDPDNERLSATLLPGVTAAEERLRFAVWACNPAERQNVAVRQVNIPFDVRRICNGRFK